MIKRPIVIELPSKKERVLITSYEPMNPWKDLLAASAPDRETALGQRS